MARASSRLAAILLAGLSAAASADQAWDAREDRFLREQLFVQIGHLPDFVPIKQTFEKAMSGDPSAAPELAALVGHGNENVAGAAAQALGRFAGSLASTTLRNAYAADPRPPVRIDALAGLARMHDPATGVLAVAALADDSIVLQGGGLGALQMLGDSAYSAAILQYMDRVAPGEPDGDLLESVGTLGDPAGSTVVRDRLAAEANKKTNDFDVRYGAARGLKAMGQVDLAKPILDVAFAKDTHDSLKLLSSAMRRLAARTGRTVRSQSDVDSLLQEADVGTNHRQDMWGRPVRARFVSEGVFQVRSDGPDLLPDTADDLSSAESWDAYVARVFADLFITP